jgi:hypothetical protein
MAHEMSTLKTLLGFLSSNCASPLILNARLDLGRKGYTPFFLLVSPSHWLSFLPS